MTRAEMLAILTSKGITLAATATDAEVKAALDGLLNKGADPQPMTAADVTKIVSDALAPIVEKLKAKATSNMGELPTERAPITGKSAADGTGINFARFVKASAESAFRIKEGRGISPVEVLRAWKYTELADRCERAQKSFTSSLLADGGNFVPADVLGEVIELLRAETVVRSLGARRVPMPHGNMSMSRQTAGATFGWVGEGTVITPSKPSTDGLKLAAKKLAGIVAVSNDLIRFADISAEEFVKKDLIDGLAVSEDTSLISGVGSQYSPIGLLYLAIAANKFNATAVDPKVPTATEVRKELGKLEYKLTSNNHKLRKPGYILTPRTEWFLKHAMLDGLSNPIFLAEMLQGQLMGKPYRCTTSVPENLGGGTDESKIYFADFDEVLIGDAQAMSITVSPDGTYEEGGVVKSGLSRDETPIRIMEQIDQNVRHTTAIAVVEAVRWGAP